MRIRIREKLLRSDTWLVIAFLALVGWSLDALLMFLEMHGDWHGGLAAFASHFWYAVPMAAAIVVLSRLKPKARLLGTAIYDEAGRLLQSQGTCCLEEMVAQGMVTALRDSGPDALQGLTLPSGVSAYFLRRGSRAVVLTFSGPASPEALGYSVRHLTAQAPVAFDMFDGLEPAVAALAANALNSPVKRDVLAHLYQFKRSAAELSDLVYRVGADQAAVLQALEDLMGLDLVCRLVVCDLTFYQVNRAPEALRLLDGLFAWQADWYSQLQKLSSYLLAQPQYAGVRRST